MFIRKAKNFIFIKKKVYLAKLELRLKKQGSLYLRKGTFLNGKNYILKKGVKKFICGRKAAFYAGDGVCQLVGEKNFLLIMEIFILYGNGRIL